MKKEDSSSSSSSVKGDIPMEYEKEEVKFTSVKQIIEGDCYRIETTEVMKDEIDPRTGKPKVVFGTERYPRKAELEEIDEKNAKEKGDYSFKNIFLYIAIIDAETTFGDRGDHEKRQTRINKTIDHFLNTYVDMNPAECEKTLRRAGLFTHLVAVHKNYIRKQYLEGCSENVKDIVIYNRKGEKCVYSFIAIFRMGVEGEHFYKSTLHRNGISTPIENMELLEKAGHRAVAVE
jgi:hypothetical protein